MTNQAPTQRVLIVSGDASFTETAAHFAEGAEVVMAHSVNEAVEVLTKAKQTGTPFDSMLFQQVLPPTKKLATSYQECLDGKTEIVSKQLKPQIGSEGALTEKDRDTLRALSLRSDYALDANGGIELLKECEAADLLAYTSRVSCVTAMHSSQRALNDAAKFLGDSWKGAHDMVEAETMEALLMGGTIAQPQRASGGHRK